MEKAEYEALIQAANDRIKSLEHERDCLRELAEIRLKAICALERQSKGKEELLEAVNSFLRAPSIGSNGPGSINITVQDFNMDAARAAVAKVEEAICLPKESGS